MKDSSQPSSKSLRGVAALFDDAERKEMFRKYLFFLAWVQLFILLGCFLYQLDDQGYNNYGPIETPFPWKVYFLLSFLAPLAITFVIGVIIIGFNRYLAEPEASSFLDHDAALPDDKSGRAYKLYVMMNWLQRLPFLSLLLLLGIAVGLFYKLDSILGFIGDFGERSLQLIIWTGATLLLVATALAIVLIFVNYKLRKKSMEYKYRTDVAERFGLIIMEDNTVLNGEGRLLIDGKNFKDDVPLLPQSSGPSNAPEPVAPLASPAIDLKSS